MKGKYPCPNRKFPEIKMTLKKGHDGGELSN
jgi:hypothetical protein